MSDMMSQEEIDAMLSGVGGENASPVIDPDPKKYLSQDEIDLLGEVGNICMGTSATTMYTLLGRRCTITTPRVTVYDNANQIIREYSRPFVIAQVGYKTGLRGNNLLLLKDEDAAVITDLLMGGEGKLEGPVEMGEMELSAMAEIMNQMVGSSATAMADLLGEIVDIAPPKCDLLASNKDPLDEYFGSDEGPVIRINFKMEIEDVLNSEIMQAMPLEFGKQLVRKLMLLQGIDIDNPYAAAPAPERAAPAPQPAAPEPAPQPAPQPATQYTEPAPQPAAPAQAQQAAPQPSVEVKQVQYTAFDTPAANRAPAGNVENIDLLMDVPLQVTVELGQTKKSIQEILDFGTGSVVVLDKLAGELVEVMVNGKLIARGEVVVIDDNYGVRITDIVSPAQRMSAV